MRTKEQGLQLNEVEVEPGVGTEGSDNLGIGFLFVLISLGFLLSSRNVYG